MWPADRIDGYLNVLETLEAVEAELVLDGLLFPGECLTKAHLVDSRIRSLYSLRDRQKNGPKDTQDRRPSQTPIDGGC